MKCMDPPIDNVPEDVWFCLPCQQKSIYQVKAVVDKKNMKRLRNGSRTGKLCMHYKIEWEGERWVGKDTWEPHENLQGPLVKALINEFNKRLREQS